MTAQAQFRWSLVACIAIGLSSVSVSSAQDIQHFRHATGTWNYFSVDGAQVSPVGQATVGLSINYARNPLVQRDENGRIVSPIVSDLGDSVGKFSEPGVEPLLENNPAPNAIPPTNCSHIGSGCVCSIWST